MAASHTIEHEQFPIEFMETYTKVVYKIQKSKERK